VHKRPPHSTFTGFGKRTPSDRPPVEIPATVRPEPPAHSTLNGSVNGAGSANGAGPAGVAGQPNGYRPGSPDAGANQPEPISQGAGIPPAPNFPPALSGYPELSAAGELPVAAELPAGAGLSAAVGLSTRGRPTGRPGVPAQRFRQ
jgi:cell division protease FtsH